MVFLEGVFLIFSDSRDIEQKGNIKEILRSCAPNLNFTKKNLKVLFISFLTDFYRLKHYIYQSI